MTPAFTARQRAERFNHLVEAPSPERVDDARHADLLDVVTALRTAPAAEPRADFVADLRSRLMVAAQTALTPETPAEAARRVPVPRRTKRERRVAVAVGGFAIVSATTSMAVAAQSALPGDTLYPLKRAIENAHVSVQPGSDDKGATMLANASGRLSEIDELSNGGSASSADITATLDDFAEQAQAASDLLLGDYRDHGRVSSLEDLRSFTAESMAELGYLHDVVPSESRPALVTAAQTLDRIDALAVQACPACTSSPVTEVPTVLTNALTDPLQIIIDTVSEPDKQHGGRSQDAKKTKKPDAGLTEKPDDQPATETGTGTDDEGTQAPSTSAPTATPPSLPHGSKDTANPPANPPADGPVKDLLGELGGRHGATTKGKSGSGSGIQHLLDDPADALDDLVGGLGH